MPRAHVHESKNRSTGSMKKRGGGSPLPDQQIEIIGVQRQSPVNTRAREAALVHDLTKHVSVVLLFVGNLKVDLAESRRDLSAIDSLEKSICEIGSIVNQLADLLGSCDYPRDAF
jgi:hypothetical protein